MTPDEQKKASLAAARERADEIIKEIRAKIESTPEEPHDALAHLLGRCMLCCITRCYECPGHALCCILTTATNDMVSGFTRSHTSREECLQMWREATDELEKILKN